MEKQKGLLHEQEPPACEWRRLQDVCVSVFVYGICWIWASEALVVQPHGKALLGEPARTRPCIMDYCGTGKKQVGFVTMI